MPAPLSLDIRNRFEVMHQVCLLAREIGRRLLISAATAERFTASLRQTGDLIQRQTHGVRATDGWCPTGIFCGAG